MSEEVPTVPEKQYLLMVGDFEIAVLTRIMPSLKFVEVRGMPITDNMEMQALVSPILKPIEAKQEESA